MCMGCAGIAMMNSDGKAPDTTETIVYFGLFALWILMLTHLKKGAGKKKCRNAPYRQLSFPPKSGQSAL